MRVLQVVSWWFRLCVRRQGVCARGVRRGPHDDPTARLPPIQGMPSRAWAQPPLTLHRDGAPARPGPGREDDTGGVRKRTIIVMLVAVAVVCLGAYYAWSTLFSSDVGGTSVADSPVTLAAGEGTESGTEVSDEAARTTFKSFAMAMARGDSKTACRFTSYRGQPMEDTDHWDACLSKVEEIVDSLTSVQLAAVQDGLRTATYSASPTEGGLTVTTTVLGKTLSGTVVPAGETARVDLETVSRK